MERNLDFAITINKETPVPNMMSHHAPRSSARLAIVATGEFSDPEKYTQ